MGGPQSRQASALPATREKLKIEDGLYSGRIGSGRVRARERERPRGAFVIFNSKDPARWRSSSALEELMTNTGRVICKQVEGEQRLERNGDLTEMLFGSPKDVCKDMYVCGEESRQTSSEASEKRRMDGSGFRCGSGSVVFWIGKVGGGFGVEFIKFNLLF